MSNTKLRMPPQADFKAAFLALADREPTAIHYLLGAGATAYALVVTTEAGWVAGPLPAHTILLAFAFGIFGGGLIRLAASRRFHLAVIREGWARYHARRRAEYDRLGR